MIKKIILHIGMYHTGTTSLQEVLSSNPPELQKKGIFFYTSVPLTYALHHECNPNTLLYSNLSPEEILKNIINTASSSGAHTLVLSHEGISYNPYYRNMTHNLGNTQSECRSIASHIRNRLYNLLKNFYVEIVFYPRRQDHWIVANYCNAINKNKSYSVTFEDILRISYDCLQYASFIESWAKLFGKESIIIRPYERIQLPKGTLYDFCVNILKCDVPDNGKEKRINQTPGARYTLLLQRINRVVSVEIINNEISAMAKEDSSTRDSYLLMGHTQRLNILSKFAKENSILAQKYLARENGQLFYEEAPTAEMYPKPSTIFTNECFSRPLELLQQRLEQHKIFLDRSLLPFSTTLVSDKYPKKMRRGEFLFAQEANTSSSDLIVRFPNNFHPERKYAIKAILSEILGYNVFAMPCEVQGYEILLPDGRCIMTLKDSLFRQKSEKSWPSCISLPTQAIDYLEPRTESHLIVFYGIADCNFENDIMHCDFDIFGMTFFLLSRLEECFIRARDKFDRPLPGIQKSFLNRPVINEWATFFEKIFSIYSLKKSSSSTFRLHMTHDIDHLKDNEHEILWLAATDNSFCIQSTFNFMSIPTTHIYDDRYFIDRHQFTKNIIDIIHTKYNHTIGFHPGFGSFIDRLTWKIQKQSLQNIIPKPLTEGRQHYIKYNYPFTWRLFEENGILLDTGLCYPRNIGYKAGTACMFTAFDIVARKPLNVKVLPLIFMDAMYASFSGTYEKFFEELYYYLEISKKYKMPCCILFHNSFFYKDNIDLKKICYKNLLKKYV